MDPRRAVRRATLRAGGLLLLVLAGLPLLPPPGVRAAWDDLVRRDDPRRAVQARLVEDLGAGEPVALVLEGPPPAPAEEAARIARAVSGWDEVGAVVGPRTEWSPEGTVSADGTSAAVYVSARPRGNGGVAAQRLVERLRSVEVPASVRSRVAGSVVEELEIARSVERDLERLVPLVFAVLCLVGYLVFRSLRVTFAMGLTLAVVLVGTAETTGLLFGALTTVTSLVAPIVLTITAANAVHWIARWRRERRRAAPSPALARTVGPATRACLLATATTGVGFLSLLVMRIPDFDRLAVLGALGCGWTFLGVAGVLPALLAALDAAPGGARLPGRRLTRAALRDLDRRGRATWGVAGLLLVIGLGAFGLEAQTRGLDQVAASSDLPAVARVLDETLGGSHHHEVLWTSGEGFRTPAGLDRLRAAAARIREALPEARLVASLATAVDGVRVVRPQLAPAAVLPIVESGLVGPLPRFLDAPGTTARLIVRTPSGTTGEVLDRAVRIERAVAAVAGPGDVVAVAGSPVLVSAAVESVVAGQALACLLSILVVSLIAVVWLRSWIVLPVVWAANLLPLWAVAGVVGATGTVISIATAMVGSVVFGLVVDDTLHFLVARREERGRRRPSRRALARLGPAFVGTTVVLVAGAAVTAIGETPAVAVFSRLMALGVLFALACDLLVAPRLAARGERRRPG